MTAEPANLAVIVASIRPERRGPVVADWLQRLVGARPEFTVDTIDLMELDLPGDLVPSPAGDTLRAAIDKADAVVVVTPEYNHGYPASLKTALDSVKYEWRGKPIGFVSYGGLAGGVRATEQLRQVAAELHMVSVRDSVALVRAHKAFGPDGDPTDGAAVDAADRMLTQLYWWATASRAQSTKAPYPG